MIGADEEDSAVCGGAVGAVAKTDVPQVVANLVGNSETDIELWIRPERMRDGYAIEWTTLEYDSEEQDWRPFETPSSDSRDRSGFLTTLARQVLSHVTVTFKAAMPSFDVDREPINVFEVDDSYLFKHYFNQDEVFADLRRYYRESDYRFEVPTDGFEDVQELLEDHFFDPVIIDDPERFCVVQRRYTDHPSVLFKASVLQRNTSDYHVFLMKDQLSVEQAVRNGAQRLSDVDIEDPF